MEHLTNKQVEKMVNRISHIQDELSKCYEWFERHGFDLDEDGDNYCDSISQINCAIASCESFIENAYNDL